MHRAPLCDRNAMLPAAGIAWGWPVDQQRFLLVEVPAAFDWWVWSFVLHWTFLAELGICAWAAHEFRAIDRLRGLKRALQRRMVGWQRGRAE